MASLAFSIGKVLWESIGLTGARTGGRRASWTNDAEGREIPEMALNLSLLAEAFLQLVASGLGALALVWATVVLLGGFSTMLVPIDFWFITAIVFIETARIVGYNSGPEARFFVDVLSDFSQKDIKRVRSLTDLVRILSKLPTGITLAPIFAAAGCITLSIKRILPIARHGKYGDSSSDSGNSNIKPALLLFYVLVLTQGSLFICWFLVAVNRSSLTEELSRRYFGNIKGGVSCTQNKGFALRRLEETNKNEGGKLINRYVAGTVDKCMEKGVLSTMNRTLVSFAAELMQSEVRADHVCAVSLLHAVITRKERTAGVVQQLCASKESVGRLFEILSSEESLFSQEIKAYTAVDTVSKLWIFHGTTSIVGTTIVAHRKPLIVHGLLILAKLAKNPKNAKEIYDNKDLLSRITAPISNESYQVLTDDETVIEMTGKSLLVLSKIVSGTDVPQEICNSGFKPNTIHPILLTDDSKYNKLKVPAIKMLTKLILTASTRDENTIAHFINVLMKLFFTDANDSILRKTAGKALALLSIDSYIFREMVVIGNTRTYDDSFVQKLTNMLSDSSNKLYRTSIAKLLMQFCVIFRSEEARQHLDVVKTTILQQVVKTICNEEQETRTNQWNLSYAAVKVLLRTWPEALLREDRPVLIELGRRKTLVAFLGLAVQMCECDRLLNASDLDAAVKQIFSSKAEVIVDKLKEIIEMCNKESVALLKEKGPSADYLEIIKSVTKLCKWVMRTKPDYRVHFQKKSIAQKLEDALEAMKGLEMSVLSCGPEKIANYETLASIVKDAQGHIPPQPDDPCCCSYLCGSV